MTTTVLKFRFPLRHATLTIALARARATIVLWRERARQRASLAEMSPEMLQDIGVSSSAARFEAGKPFWAA